VASVVQHVAAGARSSEAIPEVVAIVGGTLGFRRVSYWSVDPPPGRLTLQSDWWEPSATVLPAPQSEPAYDDLALGVSKTGLTQSVQERPDGDPLIESRTSIAVAVRAGGTVAGVLAIVAPAPDRGLDEIQAVLEEVAGYIGLFLERTGAEQRLEENRAALNAIVDGTPDAVFIKDLAGCYVMINPAGAGFLGKPIDEIIGRDDAELFALEGAEIAERDREVLRSGEMQTFEEVASAAGVTRTFLSTKSPYRDPAGRTIGLIGISRDITERKSLETHRASLLEREQEANRAKDTFLAMLAHELRNPLAPVRNALEVIRRDADPSRTAWAAAIMRRQVEHLSRLVDDLLDVARMTAGRIRIDLAPVDMADLVRRTVEENRHVTDARGQELLFQSPEAALWVTGDAARLEQVVVNLVRNASKYTGEHGRIEVALRKEAGSAVLEVTDNGIGISAEMLPKIFDPFVQGDSTLARSDGGLGIGLALVRNLVEMHDGTVAASSDGFGHGSAFVVRIPCIEQPSAPAIEEAAGPTEAPRHRVLVVEDNPDSAETLQVMLRVFGHDVEVAGDGAAAIDAYRRFMPTIALLDIGLPEMDGYELAVRLRSLCGDRRLLLIALTGYGRDEDRQRSAQAGFDHHLVKPVDPQVLEALISRGSTGSVSTSKS
jgi:PAS domain S-box-containing protein